MSYIKGDRDLHNLRFVDWLKQEKGLSSEVAGDTVSRIVRAKKILDLTENDYENYVKRLNKEYSFNCIVPSVRAQIRRALRLYFEYISHNSEAMI